MGSTTAWGSVCVLSSLHVTDDSREKLGGCTRTCCSEKKGGVHIFPGLHTIIKNPGGPVGNTSAGTPSQLVCHRSESSYGPGGSLPLPADSSQQLEAEGFAARNLTACCHFLLSYFHPRKPIFRLLIGWCAVGPTLPPCGRGGWPSEKT
jgi:hypothetical protein